VSAENPNDLTRSLMAAQAKVVVDHHINEISVNRSSVPR
jgi:hypothetical protein